MSSPIAHVVAHAHGHRGSDTSVGHGDDAVVVHVVGYGPHHHHCDLCVVIFDPLSLGISAVNRAIGGLHISRLVFKPLAICGGRMHVRQCRSQCCEDQCTYEDQEHQQTQWRGHGVRTKHSGVPFSGVARHRDGRRGPSVFYYRAKESSSSQGGGKLAPVSELRGLWRRRLRLPV